MEYVAIAILAILVVGGGLGALMMRATDGSTPASPESDDSTPVGDTPHTSDAGTPESNQQDREPARDPEEHPGNRFKSDPIGGEGEAEPSVDTGDTPRAS